MRATMTTWREARLNDQGATSVEYAVMLAMILLACFATVQAFGIVVGDSFDQTSDQIETYVTAGS